MARVSLDKRIKKEILGARSMIQQAEKANCNEAETRRRIERIFEGLMGYHAFKHLSRERAVRGAGETEHVDFAIQLDEGESARPEIMVEIKRVCINLSPKHLKQVSSYAINAGCEWILLTNSKEWRVYHVSFGQPPVTKIVHSWNLLTDDVSTLAKRFELISYKNLKKGGLAKLWQKTNVLHPRNLLQSMLSVSALNAVRRELRKDSDVLLSPEDVVSGIRRLLNETALGELDNASFTIPEKKKRIKRKAVKVPKLAREAVAASLQQDPVGVTRAALPSGETDLPQEYAN